MNRLEEGNEVWRGAVLTDVEDSPISRHILGEIVVRSAVEGDLGLEVASSGDGEGRSGEQSNSGGKDGEEHVG